MITREEAITQLTNKELESLKILEAKIDGAIASDFVPNEKLIIPVVKVTPKLFQIIKKMYEDCGWSVYFKSDQSEGEWLEFF